MLIGVQTQGVTYNPKTTRWDNFEKFWTNRKAKYANLDDGVSLLLCLVEIFGFEADIG